ncbi:MAG: tetratricopeptide repeat protein [Candidatus Tectomicrobia bacterium]|uniref:Tetratricopeptide repeat protein n=1 Tax=Tectimicrobiota bacterium TaxID=2528274 RepID=A0A932FXR4_UNCTE|nr:tetratricopeptide repeat protein [Candidatus Tectomicrobia bacterium]
MADVYLARDTEENREVALKLIEHSPDLDTQEVLEAERYGALLQEELCREDPHVVRIHGHGDIDGHFYIDMEYVEGEDLAELIRQGPLPPSHAARIAAEVCEALEKAHSFVTVIEGKEFTGIVHGDIKPKNIRLDPQGRVRLLDFGIARALSLTRKFTHNKFGSAAYSSPERLDTGEVHKDSDLWSVGVVLYEMASGRLPFWAHTTQQLEGMIRAQKPPHPLPDTCPERLREIILKALAPEQPQRYPSARAFASDLQAFLVAITAGAEADLDYERTRRQAPRGKPVVPQPPTQSHFKLPSRAKLSALVVGLLLIFALSLFLWKREDIRVAQKAITHDQLGGALYAQKDLDGAVQEYRRAIELKPDYAEAHYHLGAALRDQGNLKGAIEAYRRAIELKPDYTEAHHGLGVALKARGNLKGAIEAYRRAIELKPDYAEAHYHLGIALKDKGNLQGAIEAYRRAIELKPDYAEAHNSLGNLLKARGDLAGAIEAYHQAIRSKPGYAWAHYNLGNTLRARGDLAGAIDAYRQFIELKPGHAEAHYHLASALKAEGDLEEAIHEYQQVIALQPNHAEAHYELANILRDEGDLDGAIEAYRQATELKPGHAEAHYRLANALKDEGDLDGAIEEYRQVVKLQPNHAEAYHELGVVLYAQGDLDGAIDAYRQAIQIRPDYPEAHYDLGVALMARGDRVNALQEFFTYLAKVAGRGQWKQKARNFIHELGGIP